MELCKQWGVPYETFLDLKNWFKNQNHLPQHTPDEYFVMIIHSCYLDLQKSKKTIDAYFRLKTSTPQMFAGRSLDLKNIQHAMRTVHFAIHPEETVDGYTIVWSWFADKTAANYVPDDTLKYFFMVVDVVILTRPACPGVIFVQDAAGFSFRHMFKMTINTLMKYLEYVQDACPIRIKGINTFNTGAAIPPLLTLVKPFMYKEYAEIVNMYSTKDFEVMLKKTKISIDMVPKELGGQGPSAQKLFDETTKELVRFKDWFKFDETLRVTDTK